MKPLPRFLLHASCVALLCAALTPNLVAQRGAAESERVASVKLQGSETLRRHGPLKVSAGSEQRSTAGAARAAITADFDADGIADLVVAHDGGLRFRRGNIDAFAPRTEAAWEAIRDGRFVSPLEQETRFTALPAAADFIVAGDFNRDTRLDVAVAARGGSAVYLLTGDGAGNFSDPREMQMGGAITALVSGDVNQADGLADVIVATSGADGSRLHIFSGAADVFASEPVLLALPSAGESIAVGQLDENALAEIAVASGSDILIFSGAEMQRLPQAAKINSLIAGDFLPDRDNRT
ncbi:MAG TPA: VCBS repeat-containing protein, partial [Chthoniobacterales bacterium]